MPEPEHLRTTTDETSRERELIFKERELALKEKEVEAKIKYDQRGLWFTSPILLGVITAISGLIGTGIGAVLQGNSNLNLERKKFEFTQIQKALETTDTKEAAKRLVFLVDIGVIQSLDGQRIREIAKNEPQKIPTATVSGLTPEITGCNVGEKVRGLDRQIIFIMQRENPTSLVSFIDIDAELNKNSTFPLLQPAAKKALGQAIRKRTKKLIINAAYRSITSQLLLHNYSKQEQCGIIIAAIPGKSNHQTGLAIDIEDFTGWRSYLEAEGWRWLGPVDPVHFDFVGSRISDIKELPIKSFQKLWNLNNPEDKLPENGIYDSETEKRLNQAPPDGFPKGEKCSIECGF
ncbi:M15 family metallopeptidase [Dendronalium sp. ChiSLP03b]|uniref:M15 family metallopeptidase n=1 Tax=Dendronalium sp. ChiSLP03b TaxID=3075381 RepID=UPI002AD21C75|nr:M15 family metallopeptidase [Dendronalium sp. ChiSLP03b]MDZ8204355.1 M15 family metallopeptidase [Dendronalium sp. ChiSLP03b]